MVFFNKKGSLHEFISGAFCTHFCKMLPQKDTVRAFFLLGEKATLHQLPPPPPPKPPPTEPPPLNPPPDLPPLLEFTELNTEVIS